MAGQPFNVLGVAWYTYAKSNDGAGGLRAQVTKLEYKGRPFYVREATNGIDSFLIASNHRQGDKAGSRPGKARQTLEIFLPGYIQADRLLLEFLITAVAEADTLNRPVRTNRLFNQDWIGKIKFDEVPG